MNQTPRPINHTEQNTQPDDLYSIGNIALGLGLLITGLLHSHHLEELSYIPIVLIFGGPAIIGAAGAGSHGGWTGLTERLNNTLFFSPPETRPPANPEAHHRLI